MKLLRKFLHLPAAKRRCLISAALLLPTIKGCLTVFRFQTLRGMLARLAAVPPRIRASKEGSTEEVVWAVELVGALMPWASTCLKYIAPPSSINRGNSSPGSRASPSASY